MKYKKVAGTLFAGLFLVNFAFSADQYNIDKAHTRVGFAVKHMVISTVRGEFTDYDSKILFDENDVTKSSVQGTIKVASITTNNEQRDQHLRSGDFFDAKKYPEIKFKSKSIQKKGDGYIMTGDFTIRNVTKEVTIPFEVIGVIIDPRGNKRVGVGAEFKIKRKDYGLSWSKTLDNGGLVVGDEVTIELAFEGIQKK